MAKQPEHDEKGAAHDSKSPEEATGPSRAELIRIQLKHAAHYVAIGFAPIVSAVALAIAVVAVIGNQSIQEKLGKTTEKLEGMSAVQPASRAELEKIKSDMAQDKATLAEERKKLDEERKLLNEEKEKIIQNVSRLQVKMKISPTLADQLRLAASAPAAATVALAASAPAPAKAAAPAIPPKPVEKKFSPQVQSMKEAIEHYNKQ